MTQAETYAHRIIEGGVRHNLPQEAPQFGVTVDHDDGFGKGRLNHLPEEMPFSRRRFLGIAAMSIAASQLAMIGCDIEQSSKEKQVGHKSENSTAAGTTPEGPGSVSGAPNLPDGFSDTFTSRFVDTGKVRLHAVIGGDGPPLLLVHGWPQTWYAWRLVMPKLAQDFEVIAVDQRGIGLSDKPEDGYDTGTQAGDMVALMDALGHERFAMYGTDTGMPIAYALAADHPDRLDRLVVSEAVIAGVTPSPPLILPTAQLNEQLFHIPFNRLAELNEQLVRGREDLFFGSRLTGLPDDAVKYYVDILRSDANALRGSFGQYRAFDTTIAQNEQRMTRKLTLPVLAIGGAEGIGEGVVDTMKLVADNLQSLIIPATGHWVAEEAPDELLTALREFLAPYRDGQAAAHETHEGSART